MLDHYEVQSFVCTGITFHKLYYVSFEGKWKNISLNVLVPKQALYFSFYFTFF